MKKMLRTSVSIACALMFTGICHADIHPENTRLIMLADMGNENDELQQNVHLLMYSNEIDIE